MKKSAAIAIMVLSVCANSITAQSQDKTVSGTFEKLEAKKKIILVFSSGKVRNFALSDRALEQATELDLKKGQKVKLTIGGRLVLVNDITLINQEEESDPKADRDKTRNTEFRVGQFLIKLKEVSKSGRVSFGVTNTHKKLRLSFDSDEVFGKVACYDRLGNKYGERTPYSTLRVDPLSTSTFSLDFDSPVKQTNSIILESPKLNKKWVINRKHWTDR